MRILLSEAGLRKELLKESKECLMLTLKNHTG